MDMNKPSDILRATIKASDISQRQLSKLTGVDRVTILNFLQGGNITARNFDPLCEHMGLELKLTKKDTQRNAIQEDTQETTSPGGDYYQDPQGVHSEMDRLKRQAHGPGY